MGKLCYSVCKYNPVHLSTGTEHHGEIMSSPASYQETLGSNLGPKFCFHGFPQYIIEVPG
jgi:hypothetical protein